MGRFFSVLVLAILSSGCCQTEESKMDIEKKCTIAEMAAPSMRFIAFSPTKAFTGQYIEAGAFLTEAQDVYFRGQMGSEKIVTDENLSNKISFEIVPFPADSLKKIDEGEEDAYRDTRVQHKIWGFEVLKCGIIDLHFKLIDNEGVMLSEQHKCLYVNSSLSFFILSHGFELTTLCVSIAALLLAGTDSWLKIRSCCRRKKLKK